MICGVALTGKVFIQVAPRKLVSQRLYPRSPYLPCVKNRQPPSLRSSSRTSPQEQRRRFQVFSQTPSSDHATAENRDRLLRRLTDALILCFFACKAQPLLALDCLVHTVVSLYQQGCTISELQVMLTMRPFECGATILQDAEHDILLSWAVLVMLTLHEMEIPHQTATCLEEVIGEDSGAMRPFVNQVIARFRSGTTVQQLLEVQEEAKREGGATSSLKLMHLSSLIVMLTASVSQLLRQSVEDTSDAFRFVSAFEGRDTGCRATALKSLIAFMGATFGSVFCIDLFISCVTEGYENGLAARDLVESIAEEEYEQACRLLPVLDAGTPGIAAGISRQLFGRWVSIVYMTLAQSGLEHRLSTTTSGWAWAFETKEDAAMFEMTSLSDFVSNSLRRVAAEDADASLDLSQRLKDVPDMLEHLPEYKKEAERQEVGPLSRTVRLPLAYLSFCLEEEEYGAGWATVEDEEMRRTSPAVLAFWQMIFLVHLTYTKFMAAQEQQRADASFS